MMGVVAAASWVLVVVLALGLVLALRGWWPPGVSEEQMRALQSGLCYLLLAGVVVTAPLGLAWAIYRKRDSS